MSCFDWKAVIDIVERDFPSHIPVPSQGEVGDYRVLNFLCLAEPAKSSNHPRFYYCGNEDDIVKRKVQGLKKPEISPNNLWVYSEPKSKRSSEVSMAGECRDGAEESVLSTFSLGTISEHRVNYRVLSNWLNQLDGLNNDVVKLAQEGKLFIIHGAIMAEKLVTTEGREESKVKGTVGDLNRPKEFGGFPIGYKVGKVELRNVSTPLDRNPNYRLKLEDLRYLNVPFKERCSVHKTRKSAEKVG